MEKIFDDSKRIKWEDCEFYLLNDIRVVQYVAYLKGFDITLKEAAKVWEEYSGTVFASFLDAALPFDNGSEKGINRIWSGISQYFPEVDVEDVECIRTYENNSDSKIEFIVTDRRRETREENK